VWCKYGKALVLYVNRGTLFLLRFLAAGGGDAEKAIFHTRENLLFMAGKKEFADNNCIPQRRGGM